MRDFMKSFAWSLRRELWESRWLYLAPLAIAAVIVVGFLVYAFNLPGQVAAAAALDPMQQRKAIELPYDAVAGLMMIAGLIAGVIYSIDALYGERRDRSVLLWKSLPVSDFVTVFTKTILPVLLLPVFIWVLTVALHLVMLLTSSAFLAANGQSPAIVWSSVHLVPNSISLLYHLVVVHGLSIAPVYAWMILVSAWATRAPLAWIFLPPMAIAALEHVARGTDRFVGLLLSLLSGDFGPARAPAGGTMMDSLAPMPLSHLVAAPSLWIGFAITALFFVAAVRLRRSAQPI